MRGISTELKVGAFALAVMSLLAFMTFKVGGLEWAKKKGYVLYVGFNNVSGLDEKTKVKIAGVEAGTVEGIQLFKGKARVGLRISPDIKIYSDATAAIKSSGMLGDRFMSITIGSPDRPLLKDGDTIQNVVEVVDIDDLARNLMNVSRYFGDLTENLNQVLGTPEAKSALSRTITNLSEITSSLNRTLDANDYRLRKVLDNIAVLTDSMNGLLAENRGPLNTTVSNLRDFSGSLKSNGPELIGNLSKATKELRELVEENRPAVKSTVASLDSIAGRIDRGEGSLGKIVKDDSLYTSVTKAVDGVNRTISAVDRFRTFITFQSEYLSKPKDAKGALYVTLQPRPDKYYILGVVSDPVATVSTRETVTTTAGGTTTVSEDLIKKKIQFTAQFAKRFGDSALRIGMTENTFGAGADYFFNEDKGKISADVWDISRNEQGARNPHVKVGMDYYVFRNLFLSAGVDNVMNKKWRGGYVGGGLRFEDEDFKYLMSTMPRISTN